MKSRHKAREIALQILYQYDLTSNSASSEKVAAVSSPAPHPLIQDLQHYFEHFKVAEELREYVGQLVAGTLTEVSNLDSLLEKHASNWKVARMSSVDRSLLRMACYEMLHMRETPTTVVIDEAIELAKQFGTAETPSFINGVLDSIRKAALQ